MRSKKSIEQLSKKNKRLLGEWLIDAAKQCKQVLLTQQADGLLNIQLKL